MASPAKVLVMPGTEQEPEKRRRARKGCGCVYRPKFTGKDGKVRYGAWRIKFVYTDASGIKHPFDERVKGQDVNKSVAQERLKTRMAEAKAQKSFTDWEELTYGEMRALLLDDYVDKGNKSILVRADGSKYIGPLPALDRFFDGYKAIAIQSDAISKFKKARLAEGVSKAAINRSLQLLRRMFSLAKGKKRFPSDYVPYFKDEMLGEPDPREGYLDDAGFIRLRQELPEFLRPVLTLAYHTGMRAGEVRNLRWSAIKDGQIRLEGCETKSGKPRNIPLMLGLPEMLADRRARNPQAIYVFGDDRPLGQFRKTWMSACIRAGLGRMAWFCKVCKERNDADAEKAPVCLKCEKLMKRKYFGFIFHSLRRTAITNFVEAGVSADAAMSISGHTSQKVHDGYKQRLKERADRQAQEAKRKLEEFFSGPAISQRLVKVEADPKPAESTIN